ncbi:hypothetical protein Patl1_26603 [Pistacia atlantica]|uniref:Uncharacterized protein n=1 Tax=Pistacia atlantica TaxID=434234 RepID=A0ACC1B3H7_9ROSI|nr:hypothetical protein Patl1_26603 [Pistacia atlantica]
MWGTNSQMLPHKSNGRKNHLLDKSAFSSPCGITNTREWPCILFPGKESCIITSGFGDDPIPRLRFEAPKVKDGKPVDSTPSNRTGNAPAMFDIEARGAVSTAINSSPPSKTANSEEESSGTKSGFSSFPAGAKLHLVMMMERRKLHQKMIIIMGLRCSQLVSFFYLFLSGYERLREVAWVMRAIGVVAMAFALVTAIGLHLPNELMIWGTFGVCALSALAIVCFALK